MLKVAKIVGLNSDQFAAQALIYNLPSADQNVENSLLLIASCKCDDAFTKIRQALAESEDIYTSSAAPISQRVKLVLDSIKNSLSEVEELQILAASVYKEDQGARVLYLIYQGSNLSAMLFRNGAQSNLLDMVEEDSLMSGFLKPGDKVWLTTNSLTALFGQEFNRLKNLPVETLEEEITASLPQDKVDPLAAVFLEEFVEILKDNIPQGLESIEGESDDEDMSLPSGYRFLSLNGSSLLHSKAASQISSKLGNLVSKVKLSQGDKDIYLYPQSRKIIPSRKVLIVAAVLLFLLIGGGFIFRKKIKNKLKVQDYTLQLTQAQTDLSQATQLKDSDQNQAISNLNDASALVVQILKDDPQNVQALNLKAQIDQASPDVYKVINVSDLPVWLDLSLIKNGFKAEQMSLSGGKILLLDKNQQDLVSLDIASKSQQILAGQDKIGQGQIAALGQNFAFVYSKDKGVVSIDTGTLESSLAVPPDNDWGQIADIYSFASNIYLLDSGKNQIWKYVPIEGGYSGKRAYLHDGTQVDLNQAKRMQIDKSIWVLTNGGKIDRFTEGSPDPFNMSANSELENPQSFFVSEDTQNVYILDNGNNRLLVFDKSGKYQMQYQSEKFSQIKDLVVDEQSKKAYLLDGTKIYQLDLK